MCHEMSQYVPAKISDTDASEAHTNHGTRARDMT
jgi:hypothetical protein